MSGEEIGAAIILGITYGIVVLVTFGIGIHQYRMKTPATFYTGEKAPDPATLRDVGKWNRRHGTMWMLYGGFIAACAIGSILVPELWKLVLIIGGVMLPLPLMIVYHRYLQKTYIIADGE